MSRNRYVGDYHLADSLDERGKIRTDVEYVGDRYSFTEGPETVRRAKRKALILCAAGWLLYIGAMILPSAAMRAFWTAVPFAFAGVPLALLTGTAAEIFPRKERFEHRYADRIENRWPAASSRSQAFWTCPTRPRWPRTSATPPTVSSPPTCSS